MALGALRSSATALPRLRRLLLRLPHQRQHRYPSCQRDRADEEADDADQRQRVPVADAAREAGGEGSSLVATEILRFAQNDGKSAAQDNVEIRPEGKIPSDAIRPEMLRDLPCRGP